MIKYNFQKVEIVFLDADNTLWETAPDEFISRISSSLRLLNEYTIVRSVDGAVFSLPKKTSGALRDLHTGGVQFGLISDNEEMMVRRALELLRVATYFNRMLMRIRSFKGYCPKVEMVLEILECLKKNRIYSHSLERVLFLDDKDYSNEAHNAGIPFIRVSGPKETYELLQLMIKQKISPL